jgi:dipeptide/tripeptide permease
MELDDLRSDWQNAGGAFKSKTELSGMTRITRHPSLKKIRRKLIAETIFLLLFLFVYYDWFDGDQKPLYANLVLVIGLLLYIGNDIIGYISIARPIRGFNLKLSVSSYFSTIKRLAVFSLAFSFLYSVCLIVFFASAIHFTREKRLFLVALAIILFQVMFWSFQVWTRRIKSLQEQVKDFDTDENK